VPTVVRIRGVGFALVNLLVALVFGYGKGSSHLDFCRDVGLPDRRRVRGLGFRPFVVYPSSCRGGRFHTTVFVYSFLCFHFIYAFIPLKRCPNFQELLDVAVENCRMIRNYQLRKGSLFSVYTTEFYIFQV